MAMKEYTKFPKALGLEPHHQIQFSVKSRTFIVGSYTIAEVQSEYSTAPSQLGSYQDTKIYQSSK